MSFEYKLNPNNFSFFIREPFCIFECDNFLEQSEYNQLNSEFPAKNFFPHTYSDKGGKSLLNNRAPEFSNIIENSSVWRAFFQSFLQPACVNSIYNLVNSLPNERPAFECKPWRLVAGLDSRRKKLPFAGIRKLVGKLGGYTPVSVSFEFSYLENGCFIPPHTDTWRKLISLLLYFPDNGVDYSVGAGTEFYRGKNNTLARRAWNAGMSAAPKDFYEEHETFHTSEFGHNKLVGFIKSSYSWHGLKSLNIPSGATRRSVNINYNLL